LSAADYVIDVRPAPMRPVFPDQVYANVSRAPAACGLDCSGPVIEGNWVWLPSIGVPVPAWGFAPPGAADSVNDGFPGANGNYTNGQTSSLLGVSAVCQGGGNVQNVRQGTSGIQSGCE